MAPRAQDRTRIVFDCRMEINAGMMIIDESLSAPHSNANNNRGSHR
jgi:hypothetical protein